MVEIKYFKSIGVIDMSVTILNNIHRILKKFISTNFKWHDNLYILTVK